jgi:ABC-type phosphate transport system substrate-binding protein
MKQVSALILSALISLYGTAARAAEDSGAYKVVVNLANPASTLTRTNLARIFLRKTTTWPNGQLADPIDQPTNSAIRRAFTKGVLGMDTGAVASYLNQLIFSGRGVPPLTKPSDAEVLAYVRGNPNAIGYVAGDAKLGEGIKVMTVNGSGTAGL